VVPFKVVLWGGRRGISPRIRSRIYPATSMPPHDSNCPLGLVNGVSYRGTFRVYEKLLVVESPEIKADEIHTNRSKFSTASVPGAANLLTFAVYTP
jgi:hypothetical protein